MKTRLHTLLIAAAFGSFPAAFADTTVSSNTATVTIASGTTTINGGVTVSQPGDKEAVSFTGNASLVNNGTITNAAGTANNDRGVRVKNAFAVTVTNNGSIYSLASDGVQAGDPGSSFTLVNNGSVTTGSYTSFDTFTAGGQAVDWNKIVTGTNSLTNNAGAVLSAVGSDAVRTGVNAVVVNAGTIRTYLVNDGTGNADSSDGIDAQKNAGANITNTGTISGRHGITGGPGSAPADGTVPWITVTNGSSGATPEQNAAAVISGRNGSGINIDGVYATALTVVTNYGKITGKWDGVSVNGDGDGVDVDGVVRLDNYGTIDAVSASGVGSDGQSNIADGVSIGGGIVNNKAGALIHSAQRGILVDDSSGGAGVASLQLTNDGTIHADAGGAVVVVGTLANTIVNSATGVIIGGGTVVSNTGTQIHAAIQLGNGDDTLDTAGTITANAGYAAVDLGGGNNTMIVRGGAITGAISGGTGNSTLTFTLGASGNFAFSSAINRFKSVAVTSGVLTLNAGASLEWVFSGDTLAMRGVDFGKVDVTGGASLVVASGTLLKIVNLAGTDYSDAAWTTDRSFLVVDATGGELSGAFTLDTSEAGDTAGRGSWSLENDGSQVFAKWTAASAVPEPSSYALAGTAFAGALAALRRRRRAELRK